MGTPEEAREDQMVFSLLQVMQGEIVSAQSALNMYPEPLENWGKDGVYLSDSDGMCKHSMEYIRAAFQFGIQIEWRLSKIEGIIYRNIGSDSLSREVGEELWGVLRPYGDLDKDDTSKQKDKE